MKIGILCACAPEFEPYRATLGGESTFIHGMQRTDGVLCGHEISAVFCGIGKVNAALGAMTLIRDCGADRIIMSGVAGAIRRGVHIGQCVMITDCIYHDLSPQLITDYHPSGIDPDFLCAKDVVNIGAAEGMLCGRTVTGDVFIEQDGRESIIERFDPVCCDMETAAAAHVCHACARYPIPRTKQDSAALKKTWPSPRRRPLTAYAPYSAKCKRKITHPA